MGSTRKRAGTAKLPPPSRPPRTPWQRTRDDALRDKGFTKVDVHTLCQSIYGVNAPSLAGVRAVLDGRYVDDRVRTAFVLCVAGPKLSAKEIEQGIALYFPADEPTYRGPETQTARNA